MEALTRKLSESSRKAQAAEEKAQRLQQAASSRVEQAEASSDQLAHLGRELEAAQAEAQEWERQYYDVVDKGGSAAEDLLNSQQVRAGGGLPSNMCVRVCVGSGQ